LKLGKWYRLFIPKSNEFTSKAVIWLTVVLVIAVFIQVAALVGLLSWIIDVLFSSLGY
jgi:hypothetical protein